VTRGSMRIAALVGAILLDLFSFRPVGIQDLAYHWQSFGSGVPGLAAALDAQSEFSPDLMSRPGVVGTAIGIGPNGRANVIVLLAHASPQLALPLALDGTPVMTQVTGEFRSLGEVPEASTGSANPAASFPRPVPIGVSAGQFDVTAGTIGARVRSGNAVFALSNNHVFANRNQAEKGDNILQPGRVDGGQNPTDAIGTLHDFEAIRFCGIGLQCPENQIDAAIARTTTSDLGTATPDGGYGTPSAKVAKARLGMMVQKYGRTTGHTHGQITGINATINVGFGNGTARFTGQIVVTGGRFSAPGDSGSLIVVDTEGSDDRRSVGLLFAGSETTTLANPIALVLDRFDVTIDEGNEG